MSALVESCYLRAGLAECMEGLQADAFIIGCDRAGLACCRKVHVCQTRRPALPFFRGPPLPPPWWQQTPAWCYILAMIFALFAVRLLGARRRKQHEMLIRLKQITDPSAVEPSQTPAAATALSAARFELKRLVPNSSDEAEQVMSASVAFTGKISARQPRVTSLESSDTNGEAVVAGTGTTEQGKQPAVPAASVPHTQPVVQMDSAAGSLKGSTQISFRRRARAGSVSVSSPSSERAHLKDAIARNYLLDDETSVMVCSTLDRGKILESLRQRRPGELIFAERPVLALTQASPQPTIGELQAWVDSFAALELQVRNAILQLCCPAKAAPDGQLESLLGPHGEHARTWLQCPIAITAEDMWRFLRIMECNTFQIEMVDGNCRVELLLTTSRLNHCCLPNALRGPGTRDGTVEVRALRPLSPGEELSISYVDEETLMSPCSVRRQRLLSRWQFQCGCKRCMSPDTLRAFRCSVRPACSPHGMVFAAAKGNNLSACRHCGASLSAEEESEAFISESRLRAEAPAAARAAQAAAADLHAALEARDGPAFQKASDAAVMVLARCVTVAVSNAQVHPHHHLVSSVAKAASTLRALLGDGLAAGNHRDLAHDMWCRAASELQGAITAEHLAVPLPRDGRIADLIGLGGLHQRLGRTDSTRNCLNDALHEMRATYWATAPSRRAVAQEMMLGVQLAVGDL